METKVCTKCNRELPATTEYFYKKNRGTYIGLNYCCKECSSKDRKEYNDNNKDMILESSKEYYEKNKEKVKKRHRKYYKDNKEMMLAYGKKYRQDNKEIVAQKRAVYVKKMKEHYQKYQIRYRELNNEKINERQRKYYENNKGLWEIKTAKRRTLMKQLPSTLTNEQWGDIKNHFNNTCAYCGKELPLTVDHFIPVASGGELTRNNAIPACMTCNRSKWSRSFFEWYPKYKYYSKKREKKIVEFLGYKGSIQQLKLG